MTGQYQSVVAAAKRGNKISLVFIMFQGLNFTFKAQAFEPVGQQVNDLQVALVDIGRSAADRRCA